MFASNLCLVFLIWCQVLNLPAAANEESPADDVITLRSGTLSAAPSDRPADHSPGADWETKVKGATSSGQGTASGYRFHQEKLLEELKDYKFVFPDVLAGKQKRSVTLLPQGSYPNHISMSVKIEGKDFTLDLSRNSFLLPIGFQVSYYDSNGTLVTENNTKLYHCYYEGSVRRFPGSQVSASTCSGLSALIVFSNRTYIIEHLEGDKDGRHLLYRPEDLPPAPSSCGVKNAPPGLTLTDHLQRSQRVKRDVMSEMKYVEMVVVTDNKMYQNLGNNRDVVVNRVLNIGNAVDLYYRPFNLRIALIGVEVWTSDQMTVSRDASVTLANFHRWRQNELLPRLPNDNTQFITGGTFSGGIAGLAMLRSICSDWSEGVNQDSQPTFLAVASTLAHELGHNLGMSHDTALRNCTCPDETAGCIMKEAIGFTFPTSFSSCSRSDLERSLLVGVGVCLSNLPDIAKLVGGPECGNLYVERNEDCDCGIPGECSDICCEPATCTFKPGALCSSTGACCEDCQILPAGTLCRPSRGECDLPEFCKGDTSDCPENTYLKDGYSCSEGTFYCYSGICQSADKQCQDMWGEGATSAGEVCYKYTNILGNEFGNCGKDSNNKYVKCRTENIYCGKIQCQGGNMTPLRGGFLNVLVTSINLRGIKYKCRGAFSSLTDSSIPDLTQQGTKCGVGKVCNNKNHCHCQEGWAPPFCAVRGIGGSIDSGPMNVTTPATSPETTVTELQTKADETVATTEKSTTKEIQQETSATTEKSTTKEIQQETSATTEKSTTKEIQQETSATTEKSTTKEIQQETSGSTASPEETLTDTSITTEQSTGETPDRPDSNSLGTKIVVPVLTMSIVSYLITKMLMKAGIICRKESATSSADQLTCETSQSKSDGLDFTGRYLPRPSTVDAGTSTRHLASYRHTSV
ncbi:disintegrin and metalloproteinase domain-containing protein 12-like isoform X2 [Carcharodon carcharias]|uniref:disintegrin and metalloproteinase domain-containing protein 12-like isoform X2 n=1 Tax=Carcharodon carcharias TaxID=13397 RepID=UPI001B7DC14A|nr:disintegrin and metalloproteinase domain-containing protein 12-like isoform X2 [Carcharodon carcharias]